MAVAIKEFLPNPVGSDTEGEYITLQNTGEDTIPLTGFRVKDASGKTFALHGTLLPHEELVLPYSQTKIPLNNTGETLILFDAAGIVVDTVGYEGTTREGEIIVKGQVREKAVSSRNAFSPRAAELLEARAITAPPYPTLAPPLTESFWGVAILVGLVSAAFCFWILKTAGKSV